MVKFVTFLLCLSSLSFSLKAETTIDAKLKNCISTSNMTTAAMTNCANIAMADWDKELNQVYRALMEKLSPEAKETLKLSQRQWIKHRDKELEFIDSTYSDKRLVGSMYSNMRAAHRFTVVKNRVLELQSYLNLFK